MNVCFHYQFHPVGQGLFASGCLYQANTPQPKFLWVYDCGSVSVKKPVLWNAKVGDLRRFTHEKSHIDLLTLSHFDHDHISGVTALLGQFEVETLMLPYAPLWERLLIAFERRIKPEDERMSYYLDPVAYLRRIEGASIRRVVVVLPSDGEEFPVPDEPNVGPNHPDEVWNLNVPVDLFDVDDQVVQEFGSPSDGVAFLPSSRPLTVRGLWEFCPYNAPRPSRTTKFQELVLNLRKKLLNAVQPEREVALAALKAAYDVEFGGTSRKRNIISIFLYAGPVYRAWTASKLTSPCRTLLSDYPARSPCYHRMHRDTRVQTPKCSILYSGDGYLDTPPRFESLYGCIGIVRMSQLGVFQVNHHGAKPNWHDGLALKLNPAFSVISSDPERRRPRHPHPKVLRDFWPYSPIQVHKTGSSHCGWLLR